MQSLPIMIRFANLSDLPAYTDLIQRGYEAAFVDSSIGLKKECFSQEVFNTPDTQKYLKSHLENSDSQKTWLAFHKEKLVGAITVTNHAEEIEIKKFYVDPELKGHGIGNQLWEKAVGKNQEKDIILDVYAHNQNTIEFYKRRGFEMDSRDGKNGYFNHWPEWPEGVQAWVLYMRRPKEYAQRTK